MNLEGADVFQFQPIRRFAEIAAELRNRTDVGSLRRRRQITDGHVLDHATAQRAHCGHLETSCLGGGLQHPHPLRQEAFTRPRRSRRDSGFVQSRALRNTLVDSTRSAATPHGACARKPRRNAHGFEICRACCVLAFENSSARTDRVRTERKQPCKKWTLTFLGCNSLIPFKNSLILKLFVVELDTPIIDRVRRSAARPRRRSVSRSLGADRRTCVAREPSTLPIRCRPARSAARSRHSRRLAA